METLESGESQSAPRRGRPPGSVAKPTEEQTVEIDREAKVRKSERSWKSLRSEARRTMQYLAYEYRPYYSMPKKQHVCKLILVTRVQADDGERAIDKTHRSLIVRNFPIKRAQELSVLQDITGQEFKKFLSEVPRKLSKKAG